MSNILRRIRKKCNHFLKSFKDLRNYFYLRKISSGDYMVANSVRYYCQFASPELTDDILEKRISAQDDPRAREFGFSNLEEYEFWCWRACGIICLKMIIDTVRNSNEKVKDLIYRGIELGGYVSHDKNGKLVDKGWYYKPLIKLASEYNLHGRLFSSLSVQDVCMEILDKHFVVASVDPGIIRYDKVESTFTGGHVVLVHGFKWEDGACAGLYIHNPSGKRDDTRVAFIPVDVFKKAFAGRGFSIWG